MSTTLPEQTKSDYEIVLEKPIPTFHAVMILQPGGPRRLVDCGVTTGPATGLSVDPAKVFV